MNKIFIILLLLTVPYITHANDHNSWIDSDKTLNPNVKKEMHDYFVKSKVITDECKLKRKQLKNSLSPEAQKALTDRKLKRKTNRLNKDKELNKKS